MGEVMVRTSGLGSTFSMTTGNGDAGDGSMGAATGETVRTYAGTEGAEEMILSDGVLFALVNPELDAYKEMPRETVEQIRGASREWNWDERPRRLMALEAASGKVLWSKKQTVAPCTLAEDAGRLYFHDGQRVVCLVSKSGDERTRKQSSTRSPLRTTVAMHLRSSGSFLRRLARIAMAAPQVLQ